MSDSKFILYIRKFLKNPLLARKQLSIDLIHADVANVSKADIKAKLSKMLKCKEDALVVFGLKTKFGGGRSSGFALVYDNADAKKKYDLKKRLMSEKIIPFVPNPRKQKKDIKSKKKRLSGIAKAKVQAGKKR